MDQNIALMREGVRRGLVQPKVIMQRIPDQIAKQVVTDPEASPFYAPFRTMPASMPAAEQDRLRAAGRAAITRSVVPAYRRLQDYFVKDYLPACADSVGVWALPGGEAWYQNRIAWFTTTDLTADQIHEIGLKEVARIRGEMQKVIEQVGFKGSFPEFLQYLRTDPKFRYTDPQQLLTAYMAMAKRIDPLLPQYFGKLPRLTYGVRPIPDESAPDTTAAYYQARRAGRPARRLLLREPLQARGADRPTRSRCSPCTSPCPVITCRSRSRRSSAIGADVPPRLRGDRLRRGLGALQREPRARRWASTPIPYDKFGQLTYEMWRAVRLVVDTGIHHKHWTREQAIQFFKENAAKTELDIVNEVDRYIAWPGQALAYKIGELKIKELRGARGVDARARFDLRAFHDVVLGSGAIPLDVLEGNVQRWIARALVAAVAQAHP